MRKQATSISDYISESTPLVEAFLLFASREWYLTLAGNHVSGLITYWEFNRREFRLQLYSLFSRVEELSRDLLAGDGCGIHNSDGLCLSSMTLRRAFQQFQSAQQQFGGNRLVDDLLFRDVHKALQNHKPWRKFLQRREKDLADEEYERSYNLTTLRNAVMHGRPLFNTYSEFQKQSSSLKKIEDLVDLLDVYHAEKNT